MAAYLIADIEVTDPAGFEEYRSQVAPMIAKWGGKYLVRGGSFEKLEGDWTPTRLVVLEFENMKRLQEFYHSDEYRPLMEIRQRSTNSSVVIVEGV